MINNPVNITPTLDALETSLINKIEEAKALVTSENNETQATLAGIGTSGELDANTINVNAHTTTQADETQSLVTSESNRVLAGMPEKGSMPIVVVDNDYAAVTLYEGGSKKTINYGNFWDRFVESPTYFYGGASNQESKAHNAPYEIINLSGKSGVLTTIVTGVMNATSTYLVEIEIDGESKAYSGVMSATGRIIMGSVQLMSNHMDLLNEVLINPPAKAVIEGVGLPFSNSLKVTVTGSIVYTTNNVNSWAGVLYHTGGING